MPLPDLTDDAKMARAGRASILRTARHRTAQDGMTLFREMVNADERERPFDRHDQLIELVNLHREIEAALRSL